MDVLLPDWPAPRGVRALVTTRVFGDMKDGGAGRARLKGLVPGEIGWLRQVHGIAVSDVRDRKAEHEKTPIEGDAWISRTPGTVCGILVADCMPVLLAADDGSAVGVAHAGWRGLSAGVIEATVAKMGVPGGRLLAWLGPAIGPNAYEVGEDVHAAFGGYEGAFAPARPGHWFLDLYAVARQRLRALGVTRVGGGTECTLSDEKRFYSWRRDRAAERMAALIWLESRSP